MAAEYFLAHDDPSVRLAIASALDSYPPLAAKMWASCAKGDFVAKHYLLRWVLADEGAIEKDARNWLLTSADVRYAEPIVRALCIPSLVKEADTNEQTRLLLLVRAIYRRDDPVTTFEIPVDPDGKASIKVEPVSLYAVRALGNFHADIGYTQLVDWIVADGLKSPPAVRAEMWSVLGTWNSRGQLSKEKISTLSRHNEVIETWLVSLTQSYPIGNDAFNRGLACIEIGNPPDKETFESFCRKVIEQVDSPDEEVRAGVIRYLVSSVMEKQILE